MLSFYNEKIFYRLMNRRLGHKKVKQLRQELLMNATGAVLEIGFGTGLNLNCYPDSIQTITAVDIYQIDPCFTSPRIQFRMAEMSAEKLGFPDNHFDSVVSTFTLCTIPRIVDALDEIKRVLKPGGKFLFLEHGKSTNRFMVCLQTLANPLYNLLAHGCNVNRDILQIITTSGLSVQSVHTSGSPFLIAGWYFSGIATKAGDSC